MKKNGKYCNSKKGLNMKPLALLLALTLLVGCAVGGTLAWLTANSGPVENTFVAGQIGDLNLTETDTDNSTAGEQHQYIVIPGVDITKDPKVTYLPTAEEGTVPVDAYVFVQLTGVDANKWSWNVDAEQYEIKSGSNVVLSFSIAEGWTKLDNENVFYKTVDAGATLGTVTGEGADKVVTGVSIIANDTIEVSHEITEADIETVASAADGLTFKAYAIQQADGGVDNDHKFTPAEAWEKVSA